MMTAGDGTLHSTGGLYLEPWPVTYRLDVDEADRVSGVVRFPPGTQLQPRNITLPVYLELTDGRWAEIYLPDAPSDEVLYRLGNGSRMIDAPPWKIEGGG